MRITKIERAALHHQLLQEPLKIENGQMIIPNKPGLGADLDLDAVERYRV